MRSKRHLRTPTERRGITRTNIVNSTSCCNHHGNMNARLVCLSADKKGRTGSITPNPQPSAR
jgi:translation elongation factor EF-Tu-like GTPase